MSIAAEKLANILKLSFEVPNKEYNKLGHMSLYFMSRAFRAREDLLF
jgi:hypothetical protein